MAFAVHSSSFTVTSLLLSTISSYWASVAQTVITRPPRYNNIHLRLRILRGEGACADNGPMTAFRAFLTAVWRECKLQCEHVLLVAQGMQPSFPISQQQSSKTAQSLARKAARLDQLASLRRLGRLRKLRRLRLVGARLVIVVTFFAPLASAHPFILSANQPTLALGIADAGDAELEQPHAWVMLMCFVMILAGLAWTAWVRARLLTPRWCQHALILSGVLSLAVSIAWTAILYTVDTNQSPRYIALACWSMCMIVFLSESYQHVKQPRQYAFMVIPAFLMALHMTLFLVNYHVESGQGQLWGPRRFYENAPIAFTLWTMILRWIYHGRTVMDRRSGNANPNDPVRAGVRAGANMELPPRGANEPV